MLNFFKNLVGLPTAEEKAAAQEPAKPADQLPPVALPIADPSAKKAEKKPAKAKAKPAKTAKPAKAKAKPAKAKKAK